MARTKEQRAMQISLGKKRPKGMFGNEDSSYDSEIDKGMQDEDASQEHQQKVQDARKKKDWQGVKKLSEEWGKLRGFR